VNKVDFWEIPELWPGSTVFIIGGGPSILQQDLSVLHDKRVIGVNQAYKLGAWVDVCWFGDKQWYNQNLPDIKEYGGLIATCSHEANMSRRRKRVRYVGRSKSSGIEFKLRSHIAWNGNSGASAINLAFWLGAKTVVLLGFEMQLPVDKNDEQTHWHNDYAIRKHKGKLVDPYWRFNKHWPSIKRDAGKIGLRIINATVGGSLEFFERQPLRDIVCQNII
jgi:uncharacterized Rossmann fold enzyme